MRYKLAIFDLDGTLVDSFPWFSSILNDVADRYGFKRVEAHETDALRGLGATDMVRHLGVPAWKLPLIANHMRKRKSEALHHMRLFGGVEPMLRELSAKGIGLAVVSSDSERNVRATLGPELSALISQFGCGASLFGKAAKFRKVLRASGTAAADAVCIGDEIRDLDAARAAGVAFGAVSWGYTRPDALRAQDPDEMFEGVGEICERLCGATRKPLAPGNVSG